MIYAYAFAAYKGVFFMIDGKWPYDLRVLEYIVLIDSNENIYILLY